MLVVDGGSRDETSVRAEAAGARVLHSEAGRARQQNAGAAAATGEVLLFLHADNWLDPTALAQVRAALDERDHPVECGAFRQRIDDSAWRYRWIERGNALRARRLGLPYGDQAIFVCRELFESVGGFPEVAFMEDLILMRSLRRRAWPVLLPGPVHVAARRWQRHGVLRQTARNWLLIAAYFAGASPDRLARFYYGRRKARPPVHPVG